MKSKGDIDLEDLGSLSDRGVKALDEIRAMQLAGSMQLQSAKDHVYEREYSRLERKYGKEHPRTMGMAAKMEMNRNHIQGFAMEYAAATTPRPDAGEGWGVDGFVRTSDGDPVPGATVAAYDRKGVWHQELGYACTDEKGYFSMVAEKLPDNPPRPVFMQVSKGKRILPSSESRLVPVSGNRDRVEIIVGKVSDKGDCLPPSGDKGGKYPRAQSSGGKTQPKDAQPVSEPAKEAPKEKTAGRVVDSISAKESKEKAKEAAVKNLKEEGPKPKAVRGAKGSISKKRGK